MKKKSLKQVHDYVYLKYIEGEDVSDSDLSDEEALSLMREHYTRVALESNPDFYNYGVLHFEMAFSNEDAQLEFFIRAKRILERYLAYTGEEWDEIADRLDDINESLKDQGVLMQVESAGEILDDPELDIRGYLEERSRFRQFPEGMVMIPGGPFLSGAEKETVQTESFLIDQHPVTNSAYGEFLQQTAYRAPKYWDDERFNQPDQPVVGVSLSDAKKFARWAGKDIPNENQREKAARGTDGRTYPWGDDLRGKGEHFDLDPASAASLSVKEHPDQASVYGCQEMAGFVWEWTTSLYQKGTKLRVLKGGSWTDDERFISCDARLFANEREKSDNVGFRCCINGT